MQDPWNWNSVTRVAFGLSLVEDGSPDINKYIYVTGDKALYQGNFYSDKAPGMTFSALPAIAASKLYLNSTVKNYRWINQRGNLTPFFFFVTQIATIATSGLLTALAALALYFIAIKLGVGLGGATFGALAFGLATPAWGWATSFFGHASTTSCLFLGLVLILYLLNTFPSKVRDIVLGFASGALLSWAVVIDYTSAPVSAMISVYGIIYAWKWDRGRFFRVFMSAFAGAVIFIMPLLLYHYIIYDDPFTTGYRYHTTFEATKKGFYGISLPRASVLSRLMIDIRRGMLWYSPLLLLTPYAIYKQFRLPGQKGLAILVFVITMYYLIWNAGYIYWTGGSTTVPRFLTPILPFLCLSFAVLWSKSGNYLKLAMIILALISYFVSLLCVSINMYVRLSEEINYVTQHLIPKFIHGNKFMISYILRLIIPSIDVNSQMGLLPLYIFQLVGLVYIVLQIRKAKIENSHKISQNQ